MIDVLEINDPQRLGDVSLSWRALHSETPGATFFQTREWLEAYWWHFGQGKRLRVLVVRADGRPLGIVPLVEQTERTRLGPMRVLTFPLDHWGGRYGPIGPNQTATLAVAMRHVASTPAEWDCFQPRWLPHETTDHGRTARAMALAGMPASIERHSRSSIIACERSDGWEGYLGSLSRKRRHEIRRQRRQLERSHRLEHLRHRPDPLAHGDGDPRWDLFARCLDLSQRSWQANSPNGNTLSSRSVAGLLRDAHERAASLGMLDMSLLLADGRPASFYYAYRCGGEVAGLRMGFDPALPGAGSVLLGMVLEDSFERGDRRVDLGPGGEPYKARWGAEVEWSSRLTHTPSGVWRPRVLRAARRLRGWLRPAG